MLTLSKRYLLLEAATYRGTGAVSAENQARGFTPAFKDTATGTVYPATFVDGRPAPYHILDGMPDELVLARDRRGIVSHVVGTVIAGFLRDGIFFTRDEAATAMEKALQAASPGHG